MPDQPERPYESLLGKYVSVWLWSILFGSMSGVGYTFIGYSPIEGRFLASIILSCLLFGIGSLAALSSLIALYRGLVNFLIPKFVMGEESDPQAFAFSLRHAFLMFIIAVVTRVIMALIEALLAGFGRF